MRSSSLAVASDPGEPHRAMSPAPTRIDSTPASAKNPNDVGEVGIDDDGWLLPHAAVMTIITARVNRRYRIRLLRVAVAVNFLGDDGRPLTGEAPEELRGLVYGVVRVRLGRVLPSGSVDQRRRVVGRVRAPGA